MLRRAHPLRVHQDLKTSVRGACSPCYPPNIRVSALTRAGRKRSATSNLSWHRTTLTTLCSLDGGKASSYSQQGWVGSALGSDGISPQQGTSSELNASLQQQQQEQEQEKVQGYTPADGSGKGSMAGRDGQGSSWEEWLRVFEEMDAAAEAQQELTAKMQLAVQFEEYGRAAAVKKELEDLQAKDMVRMVQQELESALAEERYGDAARLRDQGMASLQGWWAGQAEGDPTGHVLHIGPEFGRWTGRAYTAGDLAELCGLRQTRSPLARLRTRGAVARELEELSRKDPKATIGSPAMEVFLKRGSNGSLQYQPVSLVGNIPLAPYAASGLEEQPGGRPEQVVAETKEAAIKRKQAAKAMSASLGPVVQLTVSIEADGSANIRALPTPSPAPRSSLTGRDADEAAAAMRELSEISKPPTGANPSTGPAEGSSSTQANQGQGGVGPPLEGEKGLGMDGLDRGSEVVEADAIQEPPSSRDTPSSAFPASSSSSGGGWGLMDVRGLGAKEIEALSRTISQGGQPSNDQRSSSGNAGRGRGSVADDNLESSGGSSSSSSGSSRFGSEEESRSRESESDDRQRKVSMGEVDQKEAEVLEVEEELEEEEEEGRAPELPRLPAEVVMEGRDAFVLRLPREGARAASASDEEADAATAAASSTGGPVATFEVLIPVRQFLAGSSAQDAGSADASTSSERGNAAALRGPISEALSRVATQLTSMKAMQASSSKITPEVMSEALQVVANRLTSGEATNVRISASGASISISDPELTQGVTSSSSSSSGSSGSGSAAASGALQAVEEEDDAEIHRQVMEAMGMSREGHLEEEQQGQRGGAGKSQTKAHSEQRQEQDASSIPIRYRRIPLDAPRTDPFSGLFIGSFGPHGPELLQVQRTVFQGEETVVATKLTGDPNVPAGSLSFRAKVGRKYKLSARDVYPDELGVVGRYKGQGRVAQKGNVDARWVDGELLQFVGTSPLTAGAELGFVFVVPGERRFLILLSKVDLASCSDNRVL